MTYVKLLLFGLLLTPCWGESSSPPLSESSGVSDYLELAMSHNPGLKEAFHRWQGALEQEDQVRSLPDPRLAYHYFIEEIETRVGAQRQIVEYSQTFPWFGKLEIAGQGAQHGGSVEEHRYESARRQLVWDVKQAYYEFYYLARSVAITEENVQLLRHLESVVRTRYKGNVGSHPDLIRVQIELGTLEDRLRMLTDLHQPAAAHLNAVMNRSTDAQLPWPTQLAQRQVVVDESVLLDALVETNSELMALASQTQVSYAQLSLAKKERFPDITLGVKYVDMASPSGGTHSNDDGKDAISAIVSINIPLWKDKVNAQAQEAQHRYYAALHAKKQKTNSLYAQLHQAMYRWRDGQHKITLYQQGLLPKAREGLKVTEASFRAGQSSFLDLMEAQQIYLEFALSYERALTNHEQALAQIEWLTGKRLEDL